MYLNSSQMFCSSQCVFVSMPLNQPIDRLLPAVAVLLQTDRRDDHLNLRLAWLLDRQTALASPDPAIALPW